MLKRDLLTAGALKRGKPALRSLAWASALCASLSSLGVQAQPVPRPDPSAAPSTGAPYSVAAHDALISAHRDGQRSASEVLGLLNAWLSGGNVPEAARVRLVSDAVSLAADLGRHCDAVTLSRLLPNSALADYALAPLVSAARHCGDNDVQGVVIEVWRQRMPQAREPLRQAAFWHLDTSDLAGAQTLRERLTHPLPTSTRERVDLLELDAAIALAREQRTVALGLYQQMLALQPTHGPARKQAVLLLGASGAASAAWQQARAAQQQGSASFTELEMAELAQAALAEQMKWAIAERELRQGSERTRPLDEVMAQLQAQAQNAQVQAAQSPAEAPAWQRLRHRLQWDQLAALQERGQADAALALYQQLQQEGASAPFTGQVAAAGALARKGRSHEAVRLYEQALNGADPNVPEVRNAQLALVYAYSDAGRFDAADALLDEVKKGTPAYVRQAPVAQTPNGDYTHLHAVEAELLLMGDRIQAAQERYSALSSAASMHGGFRVGAATVELRRQRPEAALALYASLLADAPQRVATRAAYTEALMEAQEWRAARAELDSLVADAGDDASVQRVQQHHHDAVAARLDVDAGGESGNLGNIGRVWTLDSRLSSPLLNDQWRVYTGYTRAQGATDQGPYLHWHRGALGLRWTTGKWEAEAQLQSANGGRYRHSVAGALSYRLSDQWRFAARHDGDSAQTPWRARAAGIGARNTELEARWIHSERRSIDLSLSRLAFSDGNARNGGHVQWRERWVSNPRLQIETTLAGGGGRYADQNRPYFSPARESSVQASVWAQFLTWRNYEHMFFQGVELSGGSYRQRDFGAGAMWNLRYEHHWQLRNHTHLRYGISVGSHPYDGRRERQRRLYLQLSVPLS